MPSSLSSSACCPDLRPHCACWCLLPMRLRESPPFGARRVGDVMKFRKVAARKRQPRRLTPEVLTELLMVHSSCVMDQQGRCPLLLSVRSLTWEINRFCNIGDEEDAGFQRHSEMLAARPLNRVMECF